MDMVEAMRVAVEVARHGSFTSASRALRISAPSVSRIVAELEADLGARYRTTRQLNLTDAGREFVQESAGLLEELDQMRGMVHDRNESPRGQLRVSCVTAFGNECLALALPEFMQRFPQLSVSVDIGNRMVDLIGEHYDVALRVGPLSDSSLIAQRISTQKIIFVASPRSVRGMGHLDRSTRSPRGRRSCRSVENGDAAIDSNTPERSSISKCRSISQ
ncbi:DNA-binding transcriptional LysR family regulator [Rhizobium mesoamericanum]|uniref:LysR family transcriptional regulator n=1 Tax=Rhizobium mesoamericanum TaxID=1079800 RepID=UPI002782409B|nr:LysR family transcriptional regulator [Rhizobium mesoamericanum]MDQ0563040.1 DNA-binding transcriptional LysR family regulator [Rhizobium mesoamericanum]